MGDGSSERGALTEGLQLASQGRGPLLQRDYWCVIRESRFGPVDLMSFVRSNFSRIPPEQLAEFGDPESQGGALELGDEMQIRLPGAGKVAVRVVHLTPLTMTVATLQGHPVAGRITFGSYRNARGDVIFHIRSRSRSASVVHHLGHLVAGEPMQSTTWTDFLDRLSHMAGQGVIGVIHEESTRVPEDAEARDSPLSPTFTAEAVEGAD